MGIPEGDRVCNFQYILSLKGNILDWKFHLYLIFCFEKKFASLINVLLKIETAYVKKL